MANLFVLPPVDASQKVRVDTAADTDSAATVAFPDGTPIPGALLTADDDGSLPRVTATESTLYVKRLTYHGDVTGTPIAVTGSSQTPVAPAAPGGTSPVSVLTFPFALTTPGLNDGAGIDVGYTPAVGDIILSTTIFNIVAWDDPDVAVAYVGVDDGGFNSGELAQDLQLQFADAVAGGGAFGVAHTLPAQVAAVRAVAAVPLKLWVRADNTGAPPGGTQGQSVLVIVYVPAA